MILLRPLAGYTLYDHQIKDKISRELKITGILGKIDEYRRNWFQHFQIIPQEFRIPLKSYYYRPLYDHKIKDKISRELQITGILDKINEYRRNWFQHFHIIPQEFRIPLKSYHYRP